MQPYVFILIAYTNEWMELYRMTFSLILNTIHKGTAIAGNLTQPKWHCPVNVE